MAKRRRKYNRIIASDEKSRTVRLRNDYSFADSAFRRVGQFSFYRLAAGRRFRKCLNISAGRNHTAGNCRGINFKFTSPTWLQFLYRLLRQGGCSSRRDLSLPEETSRPVNSLRKLFRATKRREWKIPRPRREDYGKNENKREVERFRRWRSRKGKKRDGWGRDTRSRIYTDVKWNQFMGGIKVP